MCMFTIFGFASNSIPALLSINYSVLETEPVSKHIEEQGLEFLQFAFRWFNCLLIREVRFQLALPLFSFAVIYF